MASGYKVRLGDGSEIGPMDLAALKTWLSQGLVDGDSAVMRPGSRSWAPLRTLPEFRDAVRAGLAGPAGGRLRARKATARPAADDQDSESTPSEMPPALDRWRLIASGVLLLAAAIGLGFLAWRPESAPAAFDGAPWGQMALGALAIGLALLPGWEIARRGVRAILVVVAFALFPLAGILIAQGERGTALLALASAWLFVSGLVALTGRSLGGLGLALALLPVIVGAAGVLRFGRAPEDERVGTVRAWATSDRRFTDDSIGLTLDLPPGWVVLKPGNPLVPATAAVKVTLAHPRRGGLGYVATEFLPRGVTTPEQYLGQILARRRAEHPGLTEREQASAVVGTLTGRRVDSSWLEGGVARHEVVVAGRDGWMGFALVAWMPENRTGRNDGLEALAGGLAARGLLAARLRSAVQAAVAEVPHLSASAAEELMGQSEARILEPDEAFRRSLAALMKLLPSLSVAETRELTQLTSATYSALQWGDRTRLSSYIERVRRSGTTRPEEDREAARLLKSAEVQLSATRRLRLQAYYEKAIHAGAAG
jgi:hypothetical protein